MHTQVRPSGVFLTKYVALLWVEFGQPCYRWFFPNAELHIAHWAASSVKW